jgi:hypothetical protein
LQHLQTPPRSMPFPSPKHCVFLLKSTTQFGGFSFPFVHVRDLAEMVGASVCVLLGEQCVNTRERGFPLLA